MTDRSVNHEAALSTRRGRGRPLILTVGHSTRARQEFIDLLRAHDVKQLIDVRTIPLPDLRGAIGFVPQEPFLFSDTLADNVAFGLDANADTQINAEPAELAETLRTDISCRT